MENPRQNIDDLEVPLFQETSIYLRNTFNQGQFSISRWFPRSISECRDIVIGLISQLLGLFHHAYIMLYQIKKPTKYDDYIILYNIIYNIYTLWLDSIRFSMIPVQKSSSDPWKNHEIHHETANPSGPSTWQPWVLVHFSKVITEFTGMHIRGETHDFPIVCKGFPSRNLHFLACKCPIFMIFLRFSRIFLCFSTFPICSYDFPAFSYGFSHLFPWSAGRNSPRPMDPLRPGASKSTAWSLRWAPRRAARGSRCEASALETPRWPTRWVPWVPLGSVAWYLGSEKWYLNLGP